MPDIYIDIDEPGQELVTLPLQRAIEEYWLDEDDVAALKHDIVLWRRSQGRDIALTLHEEER